MIDSIRKNAATFAAIIGIAILALVVGGYILVHQRVRVPGTDIYSIDVELPTAKAIAPGQGDTVTVSGVIVGEIGKVTLRDGHAVVRVDIRRDKLPHVFADATALARPRTPLEDMTLALDPGRRAAGELTAGGVIPVSRTLPNVNVDEILAGLDTDTRAAMIGLLQGGARSIGKRPLDLRALLKRVHPTLVSTRQLTGAIRTRRRELSRLVGNLSLLAERLGPQSADLQRLVTTANQTFGALAAQDRPVRTTLARLPATLEGADGALAAARPFARTLAPSLDALQPAVQRLPMALSSLTALAKTGGPAVRQLSALSVEGQPLARALGRSTTQIAPAIPRLREITSVSAYLTNELAYNPAKPHRSYLFWLAWFAHNANSFLSARDGNDGYWRGGQATVSCSTVSVLPLLSPALAPLAAAGVCPK